MKTMDSLITLFKQHYLNKGYSETRTGKFELHSKPYITVDTRQDAIQELVKRKITKLVDCCNNHKLQINDSKIYNNYVLVFPTGDFIGLTHCKLSKQIPKDNDYVWVCVGKNKYEQSHRVIAKCFIENVDNLPCVNHINGIKYDNRVENLEWCTYSENTKHAYRIGLEKRVFGESHHASKLKNRDIIYIREHYIPRNSEFGIRALSRKFNVHESTISDIIHYNSYKGVN